VPNSSVPALGDSDTAVTGAAALWLCSSLPSAPLSRYTSPVSAPTRIRPASAERDTLTQLCRSLALHEKDLGKSVCQMILPSAALRSVTLPSSVPATTCAPLSAATLTI